MTRYNGRQPLHSYSYNDAFPSNFAMRTPSPVRSPSALRERSASCSSVPLSNVGGALCQLLMRLERYMKFTYGNTVTITKRTCVYE